MTATGTRLADPLRGPAFGSYDPAEVGWLLADLSHVELERPVAEREAEIQAGRAHYAESLPVEYQPGPQYYELFHEILAANAREVATAVGVSAELVLAARGPDVVLLSLARAGTPVGILLRRWLFRRHGITAPHYSVSIVRGRGIDEAALAYVAREHRAADVVFVDGWTGKGAIARELAAALAEHHSRGGARFAPDIAALADPGHCVPIFGTREDLLVPSACLNSTVSGLVSRTVLNELLLRPGGYHGAKFYRHLAADDVSALFLDAVEAHFDDVAGDVAARFAARPATPAVDWVGWRAVEDVAARYGIDNLNLVKPGVGETTRVLLRRVPWQVLVRAGTPAPLHIARLADERGVRLVEVEYLPYHCVGLIHPAAGGAE